MFLCHGRCGEFVTSVMMFFFIKKTAQFPDRAFKLKFLAQ